MTLAPLRVLSHARSTLASRIAAAVPGVEVIAIPTDGAAARRRPRRGAAHARATSRDPGGRARARRPLGPHPRDRRRRLPARPRSATGRSPARAAASAVPIAEWVLAVMLAFEKRLPDAWVQAAPAPTGGDACGSGRSHGRTLGLVGLGGIGAAVAERALPFGMRVRACRRTRRARRHRRGRDRRLAHASSSPRPITWCWRRRPRRRPGT